MNFSISINKFNNKIMEQGPEMSPSEVTAKESSEKFNDDEKNISDLLEATSDIKGLRQVLEELVEILKTHDYDDASLQNINKTYDAAIGKINKLASIINFLPEKMQASLSELSKRHDIDWEKLNNTEKNELPK